MKMQKRSAIAIDYRQTHAADSLLPHPSILSSAGWENIHLEVFRQPKFEIVEHQHTMHVVACASGFPDLSEGQELHNSSGERWLDGTRRKETRKNGDIAIIPADISHRCNWNTSVEFTILAIEPMLLKQVGRDWVNPDRIELIPRFMTERDPLLQGIFSALREELETGGIGGDLLVDRLKTTLAIHLLRKYCTTSPKLSRVSGGLSQAQLTLVTDYINNNLQQNLSLEEIAAIAKISQYHFLRSFKKSMGITLHQYILKRRIERAKYLLRHSQFSIAEIAFKVGFCDQSHLTRSFKRFVGMTPKQFLKA